MCLLKRVKVTMGEKQSPLVARWCPVQKSIGRKEGRIIMGDRLSLSLRTTCVHISMGRGKWKSRRKKTSESPP